MCCRLLRLLLLQQNVAFFHVYEDRNIPNNTSMCRFLILLIKCVINTHSCELGTSWATQCRSSFPPFKRRIMYMSIHNHSQSFTRSYTIKVIQMSTHYHSHSHIHTQPQSVTCPYATTVIHLSIHNQSFTRSHTARVIQMSTHNQSNSHIHALLCRNVKREI